MRESPRSFCGTVAVLIALLACGICNGQANVPLDRPNILWITSEDNGPQLGAYGDDFADTPALDALAASGITYLNASSNAPVCAVARATLITGMYAPSIGAQYMRANAKLPDHIRLFPAYLRAAGYYCSNNAKTDYNTTIPADVWDQSNGRAHWQGRAEGQPFFSVFNINVTHESRIWPNDRARPNHDPDRVTVPPYHPDTTEVRRDWAQYYDNMTAMDRRVAALLKQLDEDGLTDDTIVFYFGDHGPGMPRGKRWLYQSGLHVPLIVRIPERFRGADTPRTGSSTDRIVSFVDFAPTVLSLAGVVIPEHMHGRAFLGHSAEKPLEFSFGYRDRMDERIDLSRSVFDGRFKYIRNYMPHRPQGQHLEYMFRMPTTRVWKRLHDEGRLPPEQAAFFEPKPREELYDTQADPYEVVNLADDPSHGQQLSRLRAVHRQWMTEIRDTGVFGEAELRRRAAGGAEYDVALSQWHFPFARVLGALELVGLEGDGAVARRALTMADPDQAFRFWGVTAAAAAAKLGQGERARLTRLLGDPSATVRVAAADAIARHSDIAPEEVLDVLVDALSGESAEVQLQAAIALDDMDDQARVVLPDMVKVHERLKVKPSRMEGYVRRVLEKAIQDLGEPTGMGEPDELRGPFQATGIKVCEVSHDRAIVWARLTRHPRRVEGAGAMPIVHYRNTRSGEVIPKQQPARPVLEPIVSFPEGVTIDSLEGAVPGMAGEVRVRSLVSGEREWSVTPWIAVGPDRDFTAQFELSDLKPSKTYRIEVGCRAADGSAGQTMSGRFRTAPSPDVADEVRFVVTTGHAYVDQDVAEGGFKIYETMRALDPDFFVHTGDILYYDRLGKALALARWHWARMYSFASTIAFHRFTPSYFMKDDHDTLVNDCWPSMETKYMGEMTFELGKSVFREQVGMGEKTYRTIRWGSDLQVWFVEGRDYRSPNPMEDGPNKTIWGAEQLAWLERTLVESDATFKVLFSPTPIVGPDRTGKRDNHANAGFANEGDRVRAMLAAHGNVYVVCGDRHWQYVSVDEKTELREYSCGPASNKHAGGWSNNRILPEHRYLNVTGGFLEGVVKQIDGESKLTFRHYSVEGEILNEEVLKSSK